MVRVEFEHVEDAEEFLKKEIINSKKNYQGFLTKKGELCIIPGKSTSPKVYVRIKKVTLNEVNTINIPIYQVDNFEWNAENTPSRD
jgi:hypothetical protein